MSKSIITGGAGFIGSHIADLLIKKGNEVVIIDNLSTGKKENINPKAKLYRIDIRNMKISKIFKKEKPDFVFHLAAQIDVRKSVKDPISDAKVNILGSLNVLENSVKNNVKKIIFASTGGAIYGEAKKIPTTEEYYEKPLSPYGINKLSIEKSLFFYEKIKNLNYAILRLSNVYGPRQNSRGEAGVVAIFIDKMLRGWQPIINGDGNQTRDYVYVKDVARAFVSARKKTKSDKFNIGTGVETSVNQIFDKIANHMKTDMPRMHADAKPGEQQRSCLSCNRAKKELIWLPEYDIDRGIKKTVEWFKATYNK
jgi:UDP-glucose 4-epimerase